MSSNSNQTQSNQEIDLGQMMHKIGGMYQGLLSSIFGVFLFFKRNKYIVLFLIIVGVAIGIYLDSKKNYDSNIIIKPNFGSIDYVYDKIELLNSKIKENDTVFLKSIGIKKANKVSKISIEPIIDVFKFIDEKERNFELIKLMAEDGNIEKVVENKTTSKNYRYHKISFSTKDKTTDEATVQPILDYLNSSAYFQVIQKENINNIKTKISANDTIIRQIDGLLNEFSSTTSSSSKSDKLVYYNENTQLNDVIKTKEELIQENGYLRVELINTEKIAKDISVSLNLENREGLKGKSKIIIPFIFVLLFLFFNALKKFYKSQSAKLEKN